MTLEEAADRLYWADLDEFVRERARLVHEFRDGGSRAEAEAVAGLRKPTVAAWALNQLARRHRRDVDLLLEAGHRLREAQAGVLQGKEHESFEQARKTETEALRRLSREAELLLEERGGASGSVLNQVADALRAAAVTGEGRELLARGRFVKPMRLEGFDLLSELAGSVPATRPSKTRAARKEDERKAQAALREARGRVREAEMSARAAERTVARLRGELEQAERDEQAARERLAAAERDVAEARGDAP